MALIQLLLSPDVAIHRRHDRPPAHNDNVISCSGTEHQLKRKRQSGRGDMRKGQNVECAQRFLPLEYAQVRHSDFGLATQVLALPFLLET
jgi:hypothetical protein